MRRLAAFGSSRRPVPQQHESIAKHFAKLEPSRVAMDVGTRPEWIAIGAKIPRCGSGDYSSAMEPAHLWSALRYVEQNPVPAGIVPHAGDYPWSSEAAHLCGKDKSHLLDMDFW